MTESTGTPQGIHAESLATWIKANIPGIKLPLQFELLAGGHSNLTYRFNDAKGQACVLRRPPLGLVLESAHDMSREYKILSALRKSGVPVPRTLALCQDKAVNDAPFYVMTYVPGLVLHDDNTASELTMPARQRLGHQVIEVLAALHQINPDAIGLGDLGRKEAYLARQLKRWTKQWEDSKTEDIPAMEETARRLQSRMPEQVGASIVHGDYRLGNMIVQVDDANRDLTNIAAVLDWELCTLGDPLADLGYLLNQWPDLGEKPEDFAPTRAGGFISRQQLCAQYTALTGRDLSQINYYRAFSWWRLAAIGQGVYRRYLNGAMGSQRNVDLNAMNYNVHQRAVTALGLLS